MEAEQLPVGWVKASLDDLIVYTLGGDWGKDADFDDTDFVQVRCIRASELRNWEREKGKTAAQRRVKKSSLDARKLKDGDILVEISGGGPEQPVGRTVVIDKTVLAQNPNTPKICTDFFRLARPSTQLVAAYLNHYLQFFYQSGRIGEYQGGSNNLRNLKFNYYLGITIPVPPITEQKRIITKIEELFSELDKGVESLRTAREQLKVYHLSILDQATGGAQSIGYETRILGDLIGPIQLGWSPKCDLHRRFAQ